MLDPLDVSLQDDELLAEMLMTTALIIAASESDRTLRDPEVDLLLDVPHRVA